MALEVVARLSLSPLKSKSHLGSLLFQIEISRILLSFGADTDSQVLSIASVIFVAFFIFVFVFIYTRYFEDLTEASHFRRPKAIS